MPLVANPNTIFTSTTTDFTGTNVNTAQPVFNTPEDSLSVAAATSYVFDAWYHIHTTGTTSHGLSLLFGGTATITSIAYSCMTSTPITEVFGGPLFGWVSQATAFNIAGALASATHHNIFLTGIVRFNAAGTFIPQYQWSAAPGVAGVTLANSYFSMTPFGSNTAKAIGPWA